MSEDLRTYRLPDGCVVNLHGIPVEIAVGFGRLDPSNLKVIEENSGCRLRPAVINTDMTFETYDPDDPDAPGPREPAAEFADGEAEFGEAGPVAGGHAAGGHAAGGHAAGGHDLGGRLHVAQQTVGLFAHVRQHQMAAASYHAAKSADGEAWQEAPDGAEEFVKLSDAEQRLYDASLNFLREFVEGPPRARRD